MSEDQNIIIDEGWLSADFFKQLGTPGMIILIIFIFLISVLIICIIGLVVVYTCISRREKRPKFGTLKKPPVYKPRSHAESKTGTTPADQTDSVLDVEMRADNTRNVISGQTVGQRVSTLGDQPIDEEQRISREQMVSREQWVGKEQSNREEQSISTTTESPRQIEVIISSDQEQPTEQEAITSRGEIAEDGSMLI